jgi:hypothetical protein
MLHKVLELPLVDRVFDHRVTDKAEAHGRQHPTQLSRRLALLVDMRRMSFIPQILSELPAIKVKGEIYYLGTLRVHGENSAHRQAGLCVVSLRNF